MAFVMLRVEVPGMDVDQLNEAMSIDSTKPQEGVVLIRNLMESVASRSVAGEVVIAIRSTTQAITAQGGGDTGDYNLL